MSYGVLMSILAAVTWGITYTLDQKLLDKVSPMVLLSINGALSMAVALPVVLWRDGPSAYSAIAQDRSWLLLLVLAQVLTLAANWLIFTSIANVGAALASIFEIAYPVFVVLFSTIVFGTALTPATMLGGTLILIGSTVIVMQDQLG